MSIFLVPGIGLSLMPFGRWRAAQIYLSCFLVKDCLLWHLQGVQSRLIYLVSRDYLVSCHLERSSSQNVYLFSWPRLVSYATWRGTGHLMSIYLVSWPLLLFLGGEGLCKLICVPSLACLFCHLEEGQPKSVYNVFWSWLVSHATWVGEASQLHISFFGFDFFPLPVNHAWNKRESIV